MLSLRISVSGGAQLPGILDEPRERGVLFVCWHDHTFVPLHVCRRKNIGVMMSRSRTGQIQAAFWRLHGWPTVWGSAKKREGILALRETLRLLRSGQSLAFTPDGPKGPRHEAKPGVVYMASNAPAAIIPLGVASNRFWQLPTWDRYLIPKPFARVHIHLGQPLEVPPNLSKDDMAQWQARVQDAISAAVAVCQQRVG
jgi:lysophospholipid acyltransferase (LPLAT)-like uncharacterized protein